MASLANSPPRGCRVDVARDGARARERGRVLGRPPAAPAAGGRGGQSEGRGRELVPQTSAGRQTGRPLWKAERALGKVGRSVKRQLQYSGQESILAWTMMGMQMYKICGQIPDIFHMYI